MGLFEFLAPPAGDNAAFFDYPPAGFTVTLTAAVHGKTVATAGTVREGADRLGVTERNFRPGSGGIYADTFSPPASTVHGALHPAVLAFGGSEGGLHNETLAGQLAAHGYPTLDLAYFAEPGLPAHLANIPLEYFAKALAVLRKQPGVDPDHVLVLGESRGGEAALLLGSTYTNLINGVIAAVPSSEVNRGYPDTTEPAWTVRGRAPQELTIPVQQIRGPVFLTCGGEDQVWDSCGSTSAITQSLTASKFAYPITSLAYPDAGHYGGDFNAYQLITAAGLTTSETGGAVSATEIAWAANTQRLLAFLATQR
jgi:dienelactone hydrolase